jgi:hypothetical protein
VDQVIYVYAGAREVNTYVLALDNPASGSNTLNIVMDETGDWMTVTYVVYTGANNGTGATATTSGNITDYDMSIALTDANGYAVGAATTQAGRTFTMGTDTNDLGGYGGSPTDDEVQLFDEVGAASTKTVGCTGSASVRSSACVVEVNASAGGGPTGGLFKPQRNLNGLGVGGPFFENPLGYKEELRKAA